MSLRPGGKRKLRGDPVNSYARDVVDGHVAACKWVMLACQRHLRDYRHRRRLGLIWDLPAALDVIDFFERVLKHSKGEWAGQALALEPWEKFFVGSIYGWKRARHKRWRDKLPNGKIHDTAGTRRFRTVLMLVPRKNGKSTIGAGLGVYAMVGDDEPGAEIYVTATKRDQARIIFDESKRMVRKSPSLSKEIEVFAHNMHIVETAAKFEPLSKEAKTAEGFNPSLGLHDELHAHKTREMWDVIQTGMGARRQPLNIGISTAGSNMAGICYEEFDYARKVLQRVFDDDTFFALIYTVDDGDDWRDPAVWAKANPNAGVSVSPTYLREQFAKAEKLPSEQSSFKSRHLNIWVGAKDQWMDMSWWADCAEPGLNLDDFAGADAYIGIDLASRIDLAALRIILRKGDDIYGFGRYWLPHDLVTAGAHSTHANYAGWAAAKWLELTPGGTIDQGLIKEYLLELCRKFQVIEIGLDPYQAVKLMGELLDEDLPVVEVGATVKNFSAPMREWEGEIRDGRYHHADDPVMTWTMSNVVAVMDKKDNIFPNKEMPANKIDPVVAEIMARNRLIGYVPEASPAISGI